MKKYILVFLCVILIFALCGCGAVSYTEEAIAAIGTVTPESGYQIKIAQDYLDNLSPQQLAKVENIEDFYKAQETYEEITNMLQDAKDAILAIGTVSPDSGEKIKEARRAYDLLAAQNLESFLGEYEQEFLTAEQKYEEINEMLNNVQQAVDAIGTVTLDSGSKLETAWQCWETAVAAGWSNYVKEEGDLLLNMQEEFEQLEQEDLYRSAENFFTLGDFDNGLAYIEKLHDKYPDYQKLQDLISIAVDAMLKETDRLIDTKSYLAAEKILRKIADYFPSYSASDSDYLDYVEKLEKKIEKLRPSNNKVLSNNLGSGYGQLTIKASYNDALVKLESVSDPNDYKLVYVRSDEEATFSVPSGEYILKYASGDTWYGLEDKFGENTSFTKADEILEFSVSYSGNYVYYSAYTVTLYTVFGGNLSTEEIDASDF